MRITHQIPTHIALQGACNARHLGGYPTPEGETRPYGLIRCESPVHLTDADITLLIKLGVRTVLDLRCQSEVEQEPNPFANVPTIALHHNPIFPTEGYLTGFDQLDRCKRYAHMLDHCGEGFLQAMRIILQSGRGVLFHCAAGKDRTGVLAMLLLLLAGVEEETAVREYCYTQTLLAPWVERIIQKAGESPVYESKRLHAAYPEYIRAAITHLRQEYYGVRGYLHAIGLQPEETETLRMRMVRPAETVVRSISA